VNDPALAAVLRPYLRARTVAATISVTGLSTFPLLQFLQYGSMDSLNRTVTLLLPLPVIYSLMTTRFETHLLPCIEHLVKRPQTLPCRLLSIDSDWRRGAAALTLFTIVAFVTGSRNRQDPSILAPLLILPLCFWMRLALELLLKQSARKAKEHAAHLRDMLPPESIESNPKLIAYLTGFPIASR
jgi:hypothetical protein